MPQANFNPWVSMANQGSGVMLPEPMNELDQISVLFNSKGTLTGGGFLPNPTPPAQGNANQPKVVPPPQPRKPAFDPFSQAPAPQNYVDDPPAVMDELESMPELQTEPQYNEEQEPFYADEPQQAPAAILPDQSQPLGVIPQEVVPQQKSLYDDSPEGRRARFSQELEIGMGNLSNKQGLAQDEIYNMKEALNNYINTDQGLDYTPLTALSDTLFGGNLTQAAKQMAPQTPAERAKMISDIQNQIATAQGKLTDDQREMLKAKIQQESYGLQRDNALEIAKINADAKKAASGMSSVRAGVAQDRLASAAADVIDKDPLVKKYYDMSEQADRDVALLDTPLLTYQNLNEVQIGLARVISGGGQSAVSREEKTEFKTLGLELANLKQKLTGQPQDVASPEIVEQLRHIGERLRQGLQKNAYNRATKLAQGRGKVYKNNPIAAEVLMDKVESYKPSEAPSELPVEAEFSPEDEKRLMELKAKRGNK